MNLKVYLSEMYPFDYIDKNIRESEVDKMNLVKTILKSARNAAPFQRTTLLAASALEISLYFRNLDDKQTEMWATPEFGDFKQLGLIY
ncbi:MAG: hypothetical protein IKC51_05845 [Myxococcaceae bacterium]|nr:hypothetical protein [Myxococcaceae bacterium]